MYLNTEGGRAVQFWYSPLAVASVFGEFATPVFKVQLASHCTKVANCMRSDNPKEPLGVIPYINSKLKCLWSVRCCLGNGTRDPNYYCISFFPIYKNVMFETFQIYTSLGKLPCLWKHWSHLSQSLVAARIIYLHCPPLFWEFALAPLRRQVFRCIVGAICGVLKLSTSGTYKCVAFNLASLSSSN